VFSSLGYIFRSGIARSYGNFMSINILRDYQTVCHYYFCFSSPLALYLLWYGLEAIHGSRSSLRQAVLAAHTCNPSYLGDKDQEDSGSKPAWENSS
jgi:hypothetical protein